MTKYSCRYHKEGTDTKDAARAFSLKLRHMTQPFDPEIETKNNILMIKHVDEVQTIRSEQEIDAYRKEVEKVLGLCNVNKHRCTNNGVRYLKTESNDVHHR